MDKQGVIILFFGHTPIKVIGQKCKFQMGVFVHFCLFV